MENVETEKKRPSLCRYFAIQLVSHSAKLMEDEF